MLNQEWGLVFSKYLFSSLLLMFNIGILIPLCSRNQKWISIFDIDFFNNFLPFFYQSISNRFKYKFYIAIDENDKFLMDNREEIEKVLHADDTLIIAPKSLNKNPYGIWNLLLEKAVNNCEYFYQCGSDIQHVTKNWDYHFVEILRKNNNLGFVGGVDKQFWLERVIRDQPGILENVFFHRTHHNIYGHFINPKFKTWFGDDYLSQLYRRHNSIFICSNILYLNSNRVGDQNNNNRYNPTLDMKDKWKDIAIEDSKKIDFYFKYFDVETYNPPVTQ